MDVPVLVTDTLVGVLARVVLTLLDAVREFVEDWVVVADVTVSEAVELAVLECERDPVLVAELVGVAEKVLVNVLVCDPVPVTDADVVADVEYVVVPDVLSEAD